MHHLTERVAPIMVFVTPVVEHWLEREIALWVHHEGSIRRPIAQNNWVTDICALITIVSVAVLGSKRTVQFIASDHSDRTARVDARLQRQVPPRQGLILRLWSRAQVLLKGRRCFI